MPGREVARLVDAADGQPAGWHEVRWEAAVASGVYYVRMTAADAGGTVVRVRRLTVLR